MHAIDRPLFTTEIGTSDFTVPAGSTFLFNGEATEDRAIPSPAWFEKVDKSSVSQVTIEDLGEDEICFKSMSPTINTSLSLFEVDDLQSLLESLPQPVYLDITGLNHRIWAPLVRACMWGSCDLRIIYLEPREYLRSGFEDAQKIYNLSERFEGIRPLPGFARLSTDAVVSSLFVPMVGFEGARLAHVIDQAEVANDDTFAIVGVPGFRPDYSFLAFQGNRRTFAELNLHQSVQFAKANCPFDAYYVLEQIHSWSPGASMRIAPIGTKPHALGAVLYALMNPEIVELIYDNPVRARGRTQGQSRVLAYAVSNFLNSQTHSEDRTH